MRRPWAVFALLLMMTLLIQLALPVLSRNYTVANPFLSLLVIISLRVGRTGGTLWGAVLGGLSDAVLPPIGFHGMSMALLGYGLSWLGGRVIMRGIGPAAVLAACAYLLDQAIVAGLRFLLGLTLAPKLFIWAIPGCLFTAALALGVEALAGRLMPQGKP